MAEGKLRTVVRLLRSRIVAGVYKGRMPGERELARDLGVSEGTIKLALMQLETVGLIQRRSRSGTFVVPREEREKTFTPMSVLFSQSTAETSATVSSAFAQAAQARGLEMSLALHPSEEMDKAIDGILLRLTNVTCLGAAIMDYPMDAARALRLASAHSPVVLVDWEMPDLILPTVNHDNREAGRIAAAHLLKLGHRNIVLADPMPLDSVRTARAGGVAETVRQVGGMFREFHGPDFGWNKASCMPILQDPNRPTAVICGGRATAGDMKAAAASLGLSVPGDLSILSLDKIDPLKLFTYIEFDPQAMGAQALNLLLDSAPDGEPQRVWVPVRLVDCGTTAPPSRIAP